MKFLYSSIIIVITMLEIANAQSQKSIIDYFHLRYKNTPLISQNANSHDPDAFRYLEKDILNGYLIYTAPSLFMGSETMVLWRRNDGRDFIGISRISCGPVCIQEYIKFFEYTDGKFKEITNSLAPLKKVEAHYQIRAKSWRNTHKNNESSIDNVLYLDLPQSGLDIKVFMKTNLFTKKEGQILIGILKFNGQKFNFISK